MRLAQNCKRCRKIHQLVLAFERHQGCIDNLGPGSNSSLHPARNIGQRVSLAVRESMLWRSEAPTEAARHCSGSQSPVSSIKAVGRDRTESGLAALCASAERDHCGLCVLQSPQHCVPHGRQHAIWPLHMRCAPPHCRRQLVERLLDKRKHAQF